MKKIKAVKAREILDSRGNPTVEAEVETSDGVFCASVPSGASVGKNEAVELRDGGPRFGGKGVLKAVKNINAKIAPKLKNHDVSRQNNIDDLLIRLDGTKNKSRLGANAILAVSMAVCRAGASAQKIPLYSYISKLFGTKPGKIFPQPCFNVVNGGAHAGNDLEIQEFMIIPQEKSFAENLRTGTEIYYQLKDLLQKNFGEKAINIGDEGGFAPDFPKDTDALELLKQVINKTDSSVEIGVDFAATQFYRNEQYKIDDKIFFRGGLLLFYLDLVKQYPIAFFEDPFAEGDWQGFQNLAKELKGTIDVFGDDLLTTNIEKIKEAENKKACNGLVLKLNQIGTISEALLAAKLARAESWKILVAHRSGETNDDFIADLAVGVNAEYIKSGAPVRGERVAKYNRLLKIAEKLGG